MSRLKKVEKYAIQWLAYKGNDSKNISNELNIPEKTVINCLEKHQEISADNAIKTATSSVSKVKNKNLMITETAAKRNKSVAIMTEAASMVGDELKKSIKNNTQSNKNNESIYRPRN
jgi:transposase